MKSKSKDKNMGGFMDTVDMCQRERLYSQIFQLNIEKWYSIDSEIKRIVSNGWKCVKFLNEEGTGINEDIETVPNDSGGVYIFLLKPDIIPVMHRYIMYIGRARRKREYSLRKRCKEYLRDTRPYVRYMRATWGKELFFCYLPIDNDETIEKVERELVRVIVPPCNSYIPDRYVDIRPEQSAF